MAQNGLLKLSLKRQTLLCCCFYILFFYVFFPLRLQRTPTILLRYTFFVKSQHSQKFMWPLLLGFRLWLPTKTKNFCFLVFINFLFFAKYLEAKNKKLKFDQIIALFSIFLNIYRKILKFCF